MCCAGFEPREILSWALAGGGSDRLRDLNSTCHTHPYGHTLRDLIAWQVSNNTFSGLRIRNASADIAYFEIFDAWSDWNQTDAPMTNMLFDLMTDPEQLHNVYAHTPKGVREQLHERLHVELRCSGSSWA